MGEHKGRRLTGAAERVQQRVVRRRCARHGHALGLMGLAFVGTACRAVVVQVSDDKLLNGALTYHPYAALEQVEPSPAQAGHAVASPRSTLQVTPDMVLRFTSIDVNPKASANLSAGISSFNWEMPPERRGVGARFAREDLLAIRYLLLASYGEVEQERWHPTIWPAKCEPATEPLALLERGLLPKPSEGETSFDLNAALDSYLCALPRDEQASKAALSRPSRFDEAVGSKVVKPILDSLALDYSASGSSVAVPTPGASRARLCAGSSTRFDAGLKDDASEKPALLFTMPAAVLNGQAHTFRLIGGEGWYYAHDFPQGVPKDDLLGRPPSVFKPGRIRVYSDWFPQDFSIRRSAVSVGLRLFLSGGVPLPPAPPCLSIAELEQQLSPDGHSVIVGFQRRARFTAIEKLRQLPDGDRAPALKGGRPDELFFVFRSEWDGSDESAVVLRDGLKQSLLVAPGDVFEMTTPLDRVPARLD